MLEFKQKTQARRRFIVCNKRDQFDKIKAVHPSFILRSITCIFNAVLQLFMRNNALFYFKNTFISIHHYKIFV